MKANYSDGKHINKIQSRLLKVLKKEYKDRAGLYCEIDEVEMHFSADGNIIILHIRYGVFNNDTTDWQRETELMVGNDNLDFLAGQFFQNQWQTEK